MPGMHICALTFLAFLCSSIVIFSCSAEDVAIPDEKSPDTPRKKSSVKKELVNNVTTESTTVANNDNNSKYPHPLKTVIDNPDFLMKGFYVFSIAGLILIVYIIYRTCRLRRSRAENRYGTQAESAQELRPLPLAIEDEDSDNDDQTLFDINSTRSATRSVLNA